VKFHDGTPLTAGDVKASVDAVLEVKNRTASFRSTLAGLVEAQVLGPLSLRFTWDTAYFLSTRNLLAGLPILPAHGLAGDFDGLPIHRAPIGTGPFRFGS
jgi:peptide/nickel transport system substrate-binding protein